MSEPITLATFPRSREVEICANLTNYRGKALIDLRQFWLNDDGIWCPTKKGAAVRLDELPALINALTRALAEVVP